MPLFASSTTAGSNCLFSRCTLLKINVPSFRVGKTARLVSKIHTSASKSCMKIWNITKSTKIILTYSTLTVFVLSFFLARLKAPKHPPELDPKGPVLWVDQRSSRPNWTRCPSQRKAAVLFDAGSESERPTCPWWKEWIHINRDYKRDATKCYKYVEHDSKMKQQRWQQLRNKR